ncbi:MAG: response regulator transcription factor [Treponema sp.]|nr:response regulator transcription factor [Treponema sp.]
MIRIVLIDDHPLAVKGIGTWLEGSTVSEGSDSARFSIVGAAGNLAEARMLLEKCEPLPEIIILDLSLGTEDGLEFIPMLKEICAKRNADTGPGILVCSMHEDPFLVKRALDAGVKGFVSKSADAGEIIAAIDAILAGKNYIDDKYRIKSPDRWPNLTPRENEIVSLIRRSMDNQQIARRLGLSIRTVENHLVRIYSKTGVSSRRELLDF